MDQQERFILLFPAARAQRLHIYLGGCGAIGSWLGVFLSKMGVLNFTLVDYDKVAPENIGVAAYDRSYMYEYKVNALRELMHLHGNEGMDIAISQRKLTRYCWPVGKHNVVIAAFDNIDARKLLWRKFQLASKAADYPMLFIDPRMGAEDFEIAATGGGTDPRALRGRQRKSYENTFWRDAPAQPCGMAAAPYTAAECAAEAAKTVRIWADEDATLLSWQFKSLKTATVMKGVELDGTFKVERKVTERIRKARKQQPERVVNEEVIGDYEPA